MNPTALLQMRKLERDDGVLAILLNAGQSTTANIWLPQSSKATELDGTFSAIGRGCEVPVDISAGCVRLFHIEYAT